MEENKNILVGGKDSKGKEYEDAFKLLQKEGLMVRKFLILLKYPLTGENYKYREIHYRREYINDVATCLSKLDFETLSKIPREKDGCAYRLDARFVKSGKSIALQIYETRTGFGGGYFAQTPALIFTEEEGVKVCTALKSVLK